LSQPLSSCGTRNLFVSLMFWHRAGSISFAEAEKRKKKHDIKKYFIAL
jgi:hypothetical protein